MPPGLFRRDGRQRAMLSPVAQQQIEYPVRSFDDLKKALAAHVRLFDVATGLRSGVVVAQVKRPFTMTEGITIKTAASGFTIEGLPSVPISVSAAVADLFAVQAAAFTLRRVWFGVVGSGAIARLVNASIRAVDLTIEGCDVNAGKLCFVGLNCNRAHVINNRLRGMATATQIDMRANHHLVMGNTADGTMNCTVDGANSRIVANDFVGGVVTGVGAVSDNT